MKTDKILWGLFFIGGGIALLLAALGIGAEYEAVRIIGSILLIGLAIVSFVRFRFFLSLVPLAFVIYLWQEQLGIQNLNMTLLVLSVAVLSIGLSIIFRKKHYFEKKFDARNWEKTEEILDDNEYAAIDVSFSEQTKYIHATNLKRVTAASNFSTVKLFFDQCQASDEGLSIQVSANFSEVVLAIPRNWEIVDHVNTFAGSVKVKKDLPLIEPRIPVEISGSINFAEIKVKYI